MTYLYRSRRFLDHDVGPHPECPARLAAIEAALAADPVAQACLTPPWSPATLEELAAVHNAEYLAELERIAARGGGRLDEDTVACADSWEVARLAAGAACDAVRRVVAGEDLTALCLVRPPGHHALARRSMGFCLLGNVAVAARAALAAGLDRVLIVDWDVHHGNGTQDMFYDEERVGFFSVHRHPFYPGTGLADETGVGAGLGATCNLPLSFGTPRTAYRQRVTDALTEFAAKLRPQLVLVSAGFDAHATDPIGSLGLEVEDFVELTRLVRGVAANYADGRLVSILEGGYNPPVLAECVQAHLRELAGG